MTESSDARHDSSHRRKARHPPRRRAEGFFLVFTDPVELGPEELRPYLAPHKEWIKRLEESGRMLMAGPLLDDKYEFSGSGLIVVRAESLADAEELVGGDPFHQHEIRSFRIVPWQVNEGSFELRLTLSSATFELS